MENTMNVNGLTDEQIDGWISTEMDTIIKDQIQILKSRFPHQPPRKTKVKRVNNTWTITITSTLTIIHNELFKNELEHMLTKRVNVNIVPLLNQTFVELNGNTNKLEWIVTI